MRILQIHNYYQGFGGEDRAVENEGKLLERQGNEVIQYIRHNDEIKKFTLWEKTCFIFSVFYSHKASREISKLVDEKNPDIAHIHNVFPLISPSVYFCLKRKNIPIIQTIHNFRFLCPNSLFYTRGKVCEKCIRGNTLHCIRNKCYKDSYVLSALYALVFLFHHRINTFKKKIDVFVCLNNFTRKKFTGNGFEQSKTKILGNFMPAVSTDLECFKEDYAVYLGRLSKEKGIFTLLAALKKTKKIRLRIIGSGGLELQIKESIKKEGFTNIELMGFIGSDERLKILRNARFSIMPSQCYENFPLAVLESFAESIPVIASRIGGLSELVEDGKNGLLFEAGNPEALADKINYMLENPDKAKAMGEYACKCIKEKYNPETHYLALIEIYKKAIENNNQRNR